MRKLIILTLCAFFSTIAFSQGYQLAYITGMGNPNGINTEPDFNTVGWTQIMPGSQSVNVWSPVQTIPFPFKFYNNPVTQYKVSQNGLITFTTGTSVLPNVQTYLPTGAVPPNTIAAFWDNFTSQPPTGSNDFILVKTFGTSPNRQLWIKYFSFAIGSPTAGICNWSCVLEETTNNIYVINTKYNSGPVTATVGVQGDTTDAFTFGDNLSFTVGNGTGYLDNDYYRFIPIPPAAKNCGVVEISKPETDCGLGSNETVKIKAVNFGTATQNTLTVCYTVNGGAPFCQTLNLLGLAQYDTLFHTFSTGANLSVPGTYSISAYTILSGDTLPLDDTTTASVTHLTPISSFPYFQNFDNGGVIPPGWINDPKDDGQNWVFQTGPTNTANTGPNSDHTTGNGYYGYVEDSNEDNDSVNLISPCFDIANFGSKFSVWVHSREANNGLTPSNVNELYMDVHNGTNWVPIDTIGHIGPNWTYVEKDLSAFSGVIKIRFRVNNNNNTFNHDIAIDDFNMWLVVPVNAGVSELINPSGNTCDLGTEHVKVVVTNFGTQSLTNIPVCYQLNGQAPACEIIPGTVAPGDTIHHTFSATANMNPLGYYTLAAYTKVVNDVIYPDDTTTLQILHQKSISSYPSLENFEAGPGDWFSGGANATWAYGTPAKTHINGASSGSKAWVTGGLGTGLYKGNEVSWVQSPCYDLTTLISPWVSFFAWWYSENNWDGTVLQYSTDSGNSWQVIGQFGDPNWYNNTSIAANPGGQNDGFSGFGSMYEARQHSIANLGGQPKVIFRFLFASGTFSNYDGFAFDDFRVGEAPNQVNLGPDTTACDSLVLDVGLSPGTYLWKSGQTTQQITVYTSGQYSVQFIDTLGFSSSDTINVTIGAPFLFIGKDTSDCDSVVLDGGNFGGTWNWSNGDTTRFTTIKNSGNYHLTITDSYGCASNEDSILVIIWGYPLINLTNDTSICSGDSLLLETGNALQDHLWSTGETTKTIWVDSTDIYSVTVTNIGGCSITDSVFVLVVDTLQFSLGPDISICDGNLVTLDPGIPGADSYLWNTGDSSATLTVDSSGQYIVTIQLCAGIKSDTVNVNFTPLPLVDLGADTATCENVGLTLDAGTGGTSYLWSTGQTSQTIQVDSTRQYSVTVTDNLGCQGLDTAYVIVFPVANQLLGPDKYQCLGNTVVLDAGAGSNYSWSTGDTVQIISVPANATVNVTLNDTNGCVVKDTVVVSYYAAPTVAFNNPVVNVCSLDSISLTPGTIILPAQSNGVFTYTTPVQQLTVAGGILNFNIPNTPLPIGAGTLTFKFRGDVNDPGEFYKVYDENNVNLGNTAAGGNCSNTYSTRTYSLTQAQLAGYQANGSMDFVADAEALVGIQCTNNSAFLTITYPIAPTGAQYLWNTGATTQQITVSPPDTTLYWVSITDLTGCSDTDTVVVNRIPSPVVDLGPPTLSTCLVPGNQYILDAGNPGSTYLWSPGATTSQTRGVTADGDYSVIVTNAAGCSGTDSIYIVLNPAPPLNLVNSNTSICEGNSITLTTTGTNCPVYYADSFLVQSSIGILQTSGGTINFSIPGPYPTPLGNATVTVFVRGDIDQNAEDYSVYSETNSLLGVTNNSSTACQNAYTAKAFVITLATMNSWIANGSVDFHLIAANQIDVTSCPLNNAYITIEYPYQGCAMSWSSGQTTKNITVSPTQTTMYTVTATDLNGCSTSDSALITVISPFTPNLGSDSTFCGGDTVLLDAGISGRTYLWSTGATTQTIQVANTGSYWVQITDGLSCFAATRDTVNLFRLDSLVIDLGPDTLVCEGNPIILDPGIVGGNYLWNTGATSQTISVDSAGMYILSMNTCGVDTDTVLVYLQLAPDLDLGPDSSFCAGDSVQLDAGNSGFTYTWSNGATSQTTYIYATGTYWANVADTNGCFSVTDSIFLLEINSLAIDLGSDTVVCGDGSFTLDAGIPGATYLWNTGAITQTIVPDSSGIYFVNVTQCGSASDTIQVDVIQQPNTQLNNMVIPLCVNDTVTIDAGYPTYNHLWSTGATTSSIQANLTGLYWVNTNDSLGCFNVTDSLDLVTADTAFSLGPDKGICPAPGSKVSFTVPIAGSAYLWSNGNTTPSITVSVPGVYWVDVITSCDTLRDSVVAFLAPNPVANLGPDTVACPANPLVLNPNAPGGTYFWSTLATTETIVATLPGTYIVSLTDSNGCSGSDTIQVSFHPLTPFNIGPAATVACGELTLDATIPAGSYLWSTGDTTPMITLVQIDSLGSWSDTIMVTATDVYNCPLTDQMIVTLNTLPGLTPLADTSICAGDTVILDATNPNAISYQWSTGATTPSILVSNPGTYSVSIQDSNNCNSIPDTIQVNFFAPTLVNLGVDSSFCSGDTITLNAGNPGGTYLWFSGNTSALEIVDSTGTYGVSVTDSNGCSATDSIYLLRIDTLVVDLGPDTSNCESLTLDVGYPGANYNWNTGAMTQSIVVNTSGTYWVDVNQCGTGTDTIVVTIFNNPLVSIGGIPGFCPGDSATLDAGFYGGTYLWSNSETSQSIQTNAAGTYWVNVTDSNGCQGTDTLEVNSFPAPAFTFGGTADVCLNQQLLLDPGILNGTYFWSNGDTTPTSFANPNDTTWVVLYDSNGCYGTDTLITGSITPMVVNLGPDTVRCGGSVFLQAGSFLFTNWNWSTGATTPNITATTTNLYWVEVTDTSGCRPRDSINVTIAVPPTLNLGPDRGICRGDSVLLDAGIVGGTYNWSSGDTTQTVYFDTSGTWTLLVTDSNGCTSNLDIISIWINELPVIGIQNDTTICQGDAIQINAGNSGQSYLWSTGDTTEMITVDSVGTYSVTVTDTFSCSSTDTFVLAHHPLTQVNLGPDSALCDGLGFTLDAGNPGGSYLWSPSGATTQVIPVGVGDFQTISVTVTDTNTCIGHDTINLTIHPANSVFLGNDTSICLGDSIMLDAQNPGSTYLWSTGSTAQVITVGGTFDFSVAVTNNDGCIARDTLSLFEITTLLVDIGPDTSSCGSYQIQSGIAGAELYNWSTGGTTQNITVTTTGWYWVEVVKCGAGVDSVFVTIHPNPVVDLGNDTTICVVDSLTLDAGNSGASFAWNTGATSQTITVNSPGTYSVVVTDSHSCQGTDAFVLGNFALPVVDLGNDTSICFGDTLLLDAQNPGSAYLWSTTATSQTIQTFVAGTYYVGVTDLNNCFNSDTLTLGINPLPIVDLGPDTSGCEGTPLLYDAGNPGANFLWSTAANTQIILVNNPAIVWVQVTDANQCSQSDTVIVDFNPIPVLELGNDTSICLGSSLTLDAGSPGANFTWSTFETTQMITVDTAGTYFVQVTDSNLCQAFDTINLSIDTLPVVNIGPDSSVCFGFSVQLDAGNSGSDYLWNTAATTQTILVDVTGSYNVTVTDGHGCISADTMVLTVNPLPVVDIGNDTTLCTGDSLQLDAGNSGANFLWSTLETTQSITVSAAGTYWVEVTDGNGCIKRDSLILNLYVNPVVNLGPDTNICDQDTLVLDADATLNYPGATYAWNSGATTRTYPAVSAGTWSVTLTDIHGCIGTDSMTLGIDSLPEINLGNDTALCFLDSLLLDAGNSGASYLWSTGATSQTITVGTAASYSVTVTNSFTCYSRDTLVLSIDTLPVVNLGNDTALCDLDTLILDAGSPGAVFNWSNASTSQTISVTVTGTYWVDVTDGNTCHASDTIQVVVNPNPVVNLGADTNICAGGSLTLDAGNAGASFLWSPGQTTQTLVVDTAAIYYVTVTDSNTCVGSDTLVFGLNPNPVVNLGNDTSICFMDTITLNADVNGNYPGATYAWSTTETSISIQVSTPGTYSVTLTDTNICSGSDTLVLGNYSLPIVNLGPDTAICDEDTLVLDAANYTKTFLWSTLETTQTINVTTTGTYSVTVTDSNTCFASDTINVLVNPLPIVDLGPDTSICNQASLTLDAGNSGASFLWSTTETTQTISVSSAGSYSVIVTDGNTCSQTDTIVVGIDSLPVVFLGNDTSICNKDTLVLDAGSPGATHIWTPAASTQTYAVTVAGTYEVTVINGFNCQASDTIQVAIYALPVVDLGIDTSICTLDTLTLDAGNVSATYLWSTAQTSQTIDLVNAGTYTVTVTDTNTCSSRDTFNLALLPLPMVDLGADTTVCAIHTLDALNPGANYLWSTSETSQIITILATGQYYVDITDSNTCTWSDTINVLVNPLPVVNLGNDTAVCFSFVLDAGFHGGTTLWNTGATTQTLLVTSTGSYSVTVTDSNGCVSVTDTIFVTIDTLPQIDLGNDTSICNLDTLTLDAGNTGVIFNWSNGATTQSIQVDTTGTYSVTVTNGNGCQGSDSFFLFVITNLAVDIGPDTAHCEKFTLNPSIPGASYLWNTGDTTQSITVNTTGWYSVSVVQCGSGVDSAFITIWDLPVVNLGNDTAICADKNITLQADAANQYPGATYLWSNSSTAANITVNTGGLYHVTLTDTNGCVDKDSLVLGINPLPVINLNNDTSICFGDTLVLDADNAGASFLWTGGATTQTLPIFAAGTYGVVVTDGNGCISSDSMTLAINALPVVFIGNDTNICNLDTLVLNAGNTGANYLWSTGASTQSIPATVAATYSVTVTDSNQCSQSDSMNLGIYSLPVIALGNDTSICDLDSLTLSAGNPGGFYLWSTLETTESIVIYSAGTYSVTVTDTHTCFASDTFNLGIFALPVFSLGNDTSICNLDTLVLDAGNVTATYAWSTLETTQTIQVSTAGTYSVTVTDTHTCSWADTMNLGIYALPIVNIGNDTTICTGDTITLDAGNPTKTFLWSTLETSQTIDIANAGLYSVTVTDSNTCFASDTMVLSLYVLPVVNLGNDTTICTGDTLVLDAQNATGIYAWSTLETTQTIQVSSAGTYSVTVTDTNTCSSSDTLVLNLFVLPVVDLGNDTTICTGDSLTLDAGNAGASFAWSTTETSQTIVINSAGSYSVTVTDGNTCHQADTFQLGLFVLPVVNIGPDTNICDSDSLLLDAGNVTSTYLWSTLETTQTIVVDTAGAYIVVVTDTNTCIGRDTLTLGIFSLPVVNLGADTSICFQDSITFDAGNNGAQFLWNTTETTQTISVSTPGTYSVLVTDGNTCSSMDSIVLANDTLPVVNLGADTSICIFDSLTLDAGSPGSMYAWSTLEISQSITVTAAGPYFVQVTDLNGCKGSDTLVLSLDTLPVVALGADTAFCAGDSLLLDAGNAGSQYLWNTSQTSQTIWVSTLGTYSVHVTDGNGCQSDDTLSLIVNVLPVINLGPDSALCFGDSMLLEADAGNFYPGSTYAWNTSATTNQIWINTTGTYSVTLTDTNSCQGADTMNFLIHALPVVNLGPDTTICPDDTLFVDAGNPGASYNWSFPGSGQTNFILTTGLFWVDVTDNFGCVGTDSIDVQNYVLPVITLGQDTQICWNTSLGLTVDPGNNYPGASYLWSTNQTSQTIQAPAGNNYWVELTDIHGCQDRDTVLVDSLPPPVPNLGPDTAICKGSLIFLNAGTFATYHWQNNNANPSIPATLGGLYWVEVTDANGCTARDSMNLTLITSSVAGFIADTTNSPVVVFTNTSTGGTTSWLWNFGDGATSTQKDPTHTYPAVDASYTVTLIAYNPTCGNDTFTTVIHVSYVGVEAGIADEDLKLYPNPSHGRFFVEFESMHGEDARIEVYSLTGVRIYEQKLGRINGLRKEEVILDHVVKGTYVVKVTIDGRIRTRKMVTL
ncbi:MAG: T9SS type A sorting domain-containing protein [Bacteroidia bacterium]|nr:T9SS type A sorting domain-containing protein [Bacteroidia bacterium]